ncbi:hypothetical protein DNTS_022971 [Danionella cerebrum]|uniref:Stabilin-1 n=1 Tax=Danionella cerebrum TaxID=2873325 RepID=A0A553RHF7_9TELE|nr:hypothetical protein DNTS_022971 [Danionella translucida]
MLYLLVWGFTVLTTIQTQAVNNRCDAPLTVLRKTLCTSCAASSTAVCPRGSRKISRVPEPCSYIVDIGGRLVELPGCTHSCQEVITVKECCPGFWGPLCLPCPKLSGKICNGFGSCNSGLSGNGTCVCEEGYAGFACQSCLNGNAFGSHCRSECSCVNGICNSGPDSDVSVFCKDCPQLSYCKGDESSAVCECLPGYMKSGQSCIEGFTGDGTHCVPINPCNTNNGGCPVKSTSCEITGPGTSRCVCLPGMESLDPSTGCTQKSSCMPASCHSSARCESNSDGTTTCHCSARQIGDGRRCYGNLMERLVELDREGSQAGNLTGSLRFIERACELTLSQHGPFTAFVPAGRHPFQIDTGSSSSRVLNEVCKNHLILGQKLYSQLEARDMWTYGGERIRFKTNMRFILMRDPDVVFTILQSDVPASNGIIHIIDKPFTVTHIQSSNNNMEVSSKSIGEIIREDDRFNRFLSLLDNCGALLPVTGSGPLTVLVPTNSAIDRFRDGSLMYMLSEAKPKLQMLLKHHMFSLAAVTVDQLASMSKVTTMASEILRINASDDGRVFLGDKGVTLETKDIVASNGIIHLIDGVLVPSSIVPIMPHRCDLNMSRISFGSCVRCSHLHETQCPPGSVELPGHLSGCEPVPDRRWSYSLLEEGCAKYCNITEESRQCCRGFYGADCKPCIGGFQHPCYDKGTCFDGINGNGSCKCEPAFTGVGCHLCSDPRKHGENCDEDCRCVHGVCDNRPGSLGVCRRGSCSAGFLGEFCDQTVSPCDSDGGFQHCHIHARCAHSVGQTTCVCLPGYEGDGLSCFERNPCLEPQRGGCHDNAECSYDGGVLSCVCLEGWTGDGRLCVEINNCLLESRGGCHQDAECTATGPGQNDCICKKGFMGDGVVCKIANPCLSDNGGCHYLAKCELKSPGTRVCTCPKEYEGDGMICYGNMLVRQTVLASDSFLTALVPSKTALKSFSETEGPYWFDYYRLPYLLQAHFLEGIYTSEDLRQQVGKTVQTVGKTKWEIQSNGKEPMISNATIITPDLKAINGCIHIIDTVLRPPLSDFPPPPPGLMTLLNSTPEFSLFTQAALLYDLEKSIPTQDYTIFVPYDSAVQEYLNQTNSTQLSQDVVRYHVITGEQLFPEHLGSRLFKSTFLGNGTQIMFFVDTENQLIANDVYVNSRFIETRHGTVFGIPRVLDVHKNHCSKDVILKISGRCGDCAAVPLCLLNAKPIQPKFPPNMKSNCKFRKRVGKKRKSVPGCSMDCLRTTQDHSCCPGYFGHDCWRCPGTRDNWCSGNGQCQDGLTGNGECLCNEGFHGTACEMCEAGRFGKDCKSECRCEHGKCLDGLEGNGQCVCFKGWKGPRCSVEVVNDACGGACDVNANCISEESRASAFCSCSAGYEGNGTFCEEINPCGTNNGGCSVNANCTKTSPGGMSCTCKEDYTGDGFICIEMDACAVNNGGCDEHAFCRKTGPNRVACSCMPGFSSIGHRCVPVNPCRKDNGGCSINAVCRYLGKGERNCSCYLGYKGDGFQCRGAVNREILHSKEASWFRRSLSLFRVKDLISRGPYTVFVPHEDYVTNVSIDAWMNSSHTPNLLRYHIVSCETLYESDLKSVAEAVTANGQKLRFSVREGEVYINDKAKIITSDYECFNGVIHFIDNILFPAELPSKVEISTELKITAAAEQYGFKMFGKLLQDAGLMYVVQHKIFYPFTMFWPTDEVFNKLPEDRKQWLYSEDHRDKLRGLLKAHIVRDQRITAAGLPAQKRLETLFGSEVTFSCNKDLVGDILINGNNARIVTRNLIFESGIAHGIDQLLEPPGIGARCDDFQNIKLKGRCGPCANPPLCPYGSMDTNQTDFCTLPFRSHRLPSYIDLYVQKHHYRPFPLYDVSCSPCNCSSTGKCDDGLEGDGSCFCQEGWTGTFCETKIVVQPVCSPACDLNAVCAVGNQCECVPPYTGNGINCTAPDLCSEYNGGCHEEAECNQTRVNVTCSCRSGFLGDGYECEPINRCIAEANGGCSDFAKCAFTGPNERSCECLEGYVGNGIQCLEKVTPPVDRCLEDNGGRAKEACEAEDATLATFSQLSDAQQLGMHLCVAGWMDGVKVGYPIRFPSAKCGDNHVGIVLYKEPVNASWFYDAYCYRMDDVACDCRLGYVGNGAFCNGDLASVVATTSNFSVFYKTLLKFAEDGEEGKNLLMSLSDKSLNITVFIPHDEGFGVNETLSWRDLLYHISSVNSLHFYEDLKHKSTIMSRLGSEISVTVPSNSTPQTEDSQLQKRLNEKLILVWNIPAVNGLIHVIDGPLRAPPLPVPAILPIAQSSGVTVTTIFIVILIIIIVAGIMYYILKHKNDAFRFQYFKNEDEDGASSKSGGNPALVSIPNPLYSGSRAFAEPFENSTAADAPNLID